MKNSMFSVQSLTTLCQCVGIPRLCPVTK